MGFTHFNEYGHAKMVDVSEKKVTERTASAVCSIKLKAETIDLIKDGMIKKGDVLSVAQVAGIMAAKKTSEIIPMCHNIPLAGVDIYFDVKADSIDIKAIVKCSYQTGVEMEALLAANTAALTIYDMCKAVDKTMTISNLRLVYKKGGKSGEVQYE